MTYISIREILDNLLDHPMLQELSLERAVNYAVQFIRIVGMPNMFVDKTATVEIKDYRGCLPCDFYEMVQVRTADKEHHHRTFRYTTDSFHMSKDNHPSPELTYKIQGTVIITSMREGSIEIAYRAMSVDNDGYPLIPDDGAFARALELYIKKIYFTILFDLGKINANILQNAQQEYAWAVGQAQTSLVKLSVDQMQALSNSLNTLVQRTQEHSKGFKDNGTREVLKIH